MNVNKLSDAIGHIDERFIASAMNRRANKKRRRFAAANFLILVLVAGFNMTTLFRCGSSDKKGDDGAMILNVIEYNGAYYEQVDMNDTYLLDMYNLPYEITSEMVGKNLGSGKNAVGEKYGNIYVYAPYSKITTKDGRTCRSVYVSEENGEYSFLLFCNIVSFDSNTHMEFTELMSFFGIDEAEDIESMTIGDEKYISPEDISCLYDIFTSSLSMGSDDFSSINDVGTDEFAHMEVLDMRIVSKEGVVINNMMYYSGINYIRWADNYFRLEEGL
ncbi:MAG: hypothetical protein IKM61_06310 [Eubacteriaceae bacterium]|nr:hypothetical protein [Eubacteriaceae bacterium]